MGKRKKGKSVKKNTEAKGEEPETLTRAPHSFVIHRGTVGKHVLALMKDFRRVMEPFTASTLKARKKNAIKDFVSISGLLHVSHMVMFTITELSSYMRVARLPQGPTLTFKIHEYVLAKDVISSLRKQYKSSKCFDSSPLIILNGFSAEGTHLKLISTMFQSMFPTLNITKVKLNTVRRCILLNYNESTKCIEFRHYAIRVTPTGLSKGVKKIVLGKVPNLSRYEDVSEFITREDLVSDMSDAEDEGGDVVLPQKMASKGNYINNTSAIRLSELGPRLTLQLVKVEGGLMEGEVMYHEFVHKTEEEIALLKKKRREKRRLKEKRKREQEMNVLKKEQLKAELKAKSLEGMRRKKESEEGEGEESKKEEEEDDDAEWYRKEVGQEPEPELFSTSRGVKRPGGQGRNPIKKKGRFTSKFGTTVKDGVRPKRDFREGQGEDRRKEGRRSLKGPTGIRSHFKQGRGFNSQSRKGGRGIDSRSRRPGQGSGQNKTKRQTFQSRRGS